MESTSTASRPTWWNEHALEALLLCCFVVCAAYEIYALYLDPQYPVADWLINYSQGFVRRGLPGEAILLASRVLHVPPPWMAVPFLLLIYGLFLRYIYVLAKPLRHDLLWYALLFSPATLPFVILNPVSGVRKEMLLHLGLALFIAVILQKRKAIVLTVVLGVILAVLVLSHETLGCCFPYFFAALAVGTRRPWRSAAMCVVPFLVAGALEAMVRHHMGSMATAMGICSSVGGKWVGANDSFNLCAGAIGHMSWTPETYRAEELANLHYWPQYALFAVLAFLPPVLALVRMGRWDGKRYEVAIIAATALVCAVASAPLFYYAIDWGRWMYMQLICLLLLILTAAQDAPSFANSAKAARSNRLMAAVVFLYCTVWTLPVLGMEEGRFGYGQLPAIFYRDIQLHRHFLRPGMMDRGF